MWSGTCWACWIASGLNRRALSWMPPAARAAGAAARRATKAVTRHAAVVGRRDGRGCVVGMGGSDLVVMNVKRGRIAGHPLLDEPRGLHQAACVMLLL